MFDSILGFATENSTLLMGGGTAGVVLFVLKKIPNEQIANMVGTFAETCGTVMTLGLGRWSFSKKFWNGTIEPWFIDLMSNTVEAFTAGFIRGLRSDNKK